MIERCPDGHVQTFRLSAQPQTVAQRRAAAGDRTNHHLAEQALRLGSHLPGSLQHSPMLHNDGNLVCSRNLNGKPVLESEPCLPSKLL
jgi:hypothetical protein